MLRTNPLSILLTVLSLLALKPEAAAQFKKEAFSNGFGKDEVSPTDSAEAMFSLKEYFQGLSHKTDLKIGTLAGGSALFVGGMQIYEKKYWKLPIIYGGLGATIGGGFYYRNKYLTSLNAYNEAFAADPLTTLTIDDKAKTTSTLLFAGGALLYWSTIMDGVISFKTDNPHHAGKATLYSILMPGLGQAYNGEFWKIPIYWGALAGSYHFYNTNRINYKRFKRIHNEATDPEAHYQESISAETALYYRNLYRRYRDYSVLAIAGFYLIQVIDANVFSYMQDFEVTDDISMNVAPTVLTTDNQFAMQPTGIGLSLGLRF